MAQLTIRGLDDETLRRLRRRAKHHGRTLQAEIKEILEQAAVFSMPEAHDIADRWAAKLTGSKLSDSAALTREDRNR